MTREGHYLVKLQRDNAVMSGSISRSPITADISSVRTLIAYCVLRNFACCALFSIFGGKLFECRARKQIVTVMSYSAESSRKAPYSSDLRWRVVWHCSCRRLNIAHSTAHAIFKRFEATGEVEADKQPSRPQCHKLDDHHEVLIISMMMECPTLYLHELCKKNRGS